MITILTSFWGIAYLTIGAVVGVLAARGMHWVVGVEDPADARYRDVVRDAALRDVMFFIVARAFIIAGALWPLVLIVHIINRVAAQRAADYNTELDQEDEW